MRKVAVGLAASALVLSVAVPVTASASERTVTATLTPVTSLDAGQSREFFAGFATTGLRPTVFTVTLPVGADRPTGVGILSGPGCEPPRVKTTVVRVAKHWTIAGLQRCSRDAQFSVVFTTAFSHRPTADISWLVSENLFHSTSTRTGSFPSIAVTEPQPDDLGTIAVARGEVVDWASDTVSARDDVPLLAGTTSNAYRLTWTAPRAVNPEGDSRHQQLTIIFPSQLPMHRGSDIGGTCSVVDDENNLAVEDGTTSDGLDTVTFTALKCATGDTLVLDFMGVGQEYVDGAYVQTPLAIGPLTFETLLSGFAVPDGSGLPEVPGASIVQAIAPAHSIDVEVGDRLASDAYSRQVTLTVRKANGRVDYGFSGEVEYARARCGIPGLMASSGWTGHALKFGRATFTITSPDLNQTFMTGPMENQTTLVTSPTSTDYWVARLSDGTALIKGQSFQLGPVGADQLGVGNGYECPTRGIF